MKHFQLGNFSTAVAVKDNELKQPDSIYVLFECAQQTNGKQRVKVGHKR